MQNERCTEDIVVRMAKCILNFSFTFVFKKYCEIALKESEGFGTEITPDFFVGISPEEKKAIRKGLTFELRCFIFKRLEEGFDFPEISEVIKTVENRINKFQSDSGSCFSVRVSEKFDHFVPCIGIVLCESLELLGEIIKKLKFEFEII